MPRHVINDKTVLEKWIDVFCKNKEFAIITTDNNEVILEPLRSTRPLNYAYFKSATNPKDFGAELSKKYDMPHLHIAAFEWDLDKPTGIQAKPEE
jgi:hypothetical protein